MEQVNIDTSRIELSPSEIIEEAQVLLMPINYEPHHTAYYVTKNGDDEGGSYCINCIKDAVKQSRKSYREQRQKILAKFKEIEETGFFNGHNVKEKYSNAEIKYSKKIELKEYPSRVKFDCEGHDPDFGGGLDWPKSCDECGDYFCADFRPGLEESKELLERFGDGSDVSDELKWLLDVAFDNWEYMADAKEAKDILLSIAKKIIAPSEQGEN